MKSVPLYQLEGSPCEAIELETPLPRDTVCARCKLGGNTSGPKAVASQRVHTVCIAAELAGPAGAPVAYVLGSAPGGQEDRTGRPNVAAAGDYLRTALGRYWQGQVMHDYAVRCAPGREKTTPAMITACRPYAAHVFRAAGAERVLLLGREAMTCFLGEGFPPQGVRRGYTFTAAGVPVFLLANPVVALRNRFQRAWFEEDLEWALTATPPKPPHEGVRWVVETEEDWLEAREQLEMAPWMTADCETYGAPHNAEFAVLDLALTPGGEDEAYCFGRSAFERLRPQLAEFLTRKDVRVGGHGFKFDQLALRASLGQWVDAAFDTMWLRRFFESAVGLNLEEAQASVGMTGGKRAVAHVDQGVVNLRKHVKGPGPRSKLPANGWWHSSPDAFRNRAELEAAVERVREGEEPRRYAYAAIPREQRAAYNALDTVSADRIHRRYRTQPGAEAARARGVWEKIGQGMNHALVRMEWNGIKADRKQIHSLITLMQGRITDVELRVNAQYPGGPYNFHSGSPDSAKLLFDVLHLPCRALTKTGKRQVTAEILEKLDHPTADDIVTWRKASHFKAQYAEGMLACIRDDGRIHCSIQGVGTETGRPSSADPNLFNMPRVDSADGAGKLCRDVFIADDEPSDDPWELLEADQSQVELRVAAMLSADEKMIEVFKEGGDVHLAAAIITAPMLKIDVEEVRRLGKKHPHRSNTKAVVFGALYGEPPGALAKKLGISVRQAEALQKMIFGHYKKLDAWCKEQARFARHNGYCYTWWDGEPFRRRLLTDIASPEEGQRDTAERSSWNTPIQGTAADFTNASLGAMQRWIEQRWAGVPEHLIPCRMVLTVYDSILFEVRQSVLLEVAHKATEVMQSWPVLHGMPLKAELKKGKAFGSLEDFEV